MPSFNEIETRRILLLALLVACAATYVYWPHERKKRIILGLWCVFLALMVFGPPILTLAWHVRNGRHVSFEGKKISVPLSWTADVTSEGISKGVRLTRLPSNILLPEREGLISLHPLDDPKVESQEQELKTWSEVYFLGHSRSLGRVSGPTRIGPADKGIFCIQEFSGNNAAASCLLSGPKWNADFFGTKKDLESFFAIIQGIR